MATLNTLRTKGGFIVSIVIGVSLLAFLLGDLTSGNGGMLGSRESRVGKIAGTSVDYTEYAAQIDRTTRVTQLLTQTASLDEQQLDRVRAMAWEELIMRYSYRPGFDKLGLVTSAGEQQDMVSGVYVSPVLMQMFPDRESLAEFIANKDANPNDQLLWDYLKEQMVGQRLFSKYMALVAGGMMVTDQEVGRSLEAASKSFSARYAMLPYTTIADSTVALTNSDIRAYYSDHKAQFRQGETRGVEYVLFEMNPSPQDYADAAEHVATLAGEFAAADDPLAYAEANTQGRIDRRFVKASEIPSAMADVIFSGGTYGPELQGDTYVLARLGGQHTWPDTLSARHIVLMPDQQSLADSIVRGLRAGQVTFERAALLHSLDQRSPGGELGRFAPEDFPIAEITEALMAHRVGEPFTIASPMGLHVMELTYRAPLVTKYRIADLIYNVDPSAATENAVYGEASAFLAQADGSAANFDAAVDAAGGKIFKRAARIANTDRNVSGLQNSLEMVRWAYSQKKAGTVSEIMQVGDDYAVGVLTDVRHAGVAPIDQAAQTIRTLLLRDRKAEQLAGRMQGSSLEAVASAVGAEVMSAQNVKMNDFFIDGAGVEPQLIGAICSSKPGVLSKPVQGFAGVYVFEVGDVLAADSDATAESERVRLEAMATDYLSDRLNQALEQESRVEDMRVKFF